MAEKDDLIFNTPPNLLTLSRMALVPFVVGLMFLREPRWDFAAAVVFGIAGATDWFDGWLARRMNIETVYGKLMDPLADKFLVASTLIMLQEMGRIHPVIVILLICRELAITGLRALASAEGVVIAASQSAKWKTATQMAAIPMIMLDSGTGSWLWGLPLYRFGLGILYISLAISLWSARDYVVDFFRALREKRRLRREARKEMKERNRSMETP